MPADSLIITRRYTEAEYLAFEEKAAGRWEFMGGRIYPVGRPDLVNQLDYTFKAGATINSASAGFSAT